MLSCYFVAGGGLRGPAAILSISRDTCSDSIAKSFRACFYRVSHNYRAICCKMGYRTLCQMFPCKTRRTTNVQQLTCNIDLSSSFYYLFFSFVLIELKPFVLKGKVLGEKFWKSVKKCENYETILPFSCCPLVFLWLLFWQNARTNTQNQKLLSPPNPPKSLERKGDLVARDCGYPLSRYTCRSWFPGFYSVLQV